VTLEPRCSSCSAWATMMTSWAAFILYHYSD